MSEPKPEAPYYQDDSVVPETPGSYFLFESTDESFTPSAWLKQMAFSIHTKNDVNPVIEQIISEVCQSKRNIHISAGYLTDILLSLISGGCERLIYLGINSPEEIKVIKEHTQLLKKFNTLAWAHATHRPITTLFELHKIFSSVRGDYVKRFGPIVKMPFIQELFPDLTPVDEPVQITGFAVVHTLALRLKSMDEKTAKTFWDKIFTQRQKNHCLLHNLTSKSLFKEMTTILKTSLAKCNIRVNDLPQLKVALETYRKEHLNLDRTMNILAENITNNGLTSGVYSEILAYLKMSPKNALTKLIAVVESGCNNPNTKTYNSASSKNLLNVLRKLSSSPADEIYTMMYLFKKSWEIVVKQKKGKHRGTQTTIDLLAIQSIENQQESQPSSEMQQEEVNRSNLTVNYSQLRDFVMNLSPVQHRNLDILLAIVVDKFCLEPDETLLNLLKDIQKDLTTWVPPVLITQTELLSKLTSKESKEFMTSSFLAKQNVDDIMKFLSKCPPLVNLNHWSIWNDIYAPRWGDLVGFLSSYYSIARNHNVGVFIVNNSNNLLRVYVESSTENIQNCWMSLLTSEVKTIQQVQHFLALLISFYAENQDDVLLLQSIETPLRDFLFTNSNSLDSLFNIFDLICSTELPSSILASILNKMFFLPLSELCHQLPRDHMEFDTTLSSIHHRWIIKNHISFSSSCFLLTKKIEIAHQLHLVDLLETCLWEQTMISCQNTVMEEEKKEVENENHVDNNSLDVFCQELPVELSAIEVSSMNLQEEPKNKTVELQLKEEEKEIPITMMLDSEAVHRGRQLIESIRQSEFGVGLELDETTETVLKSYRGRLSRSLDYLSEDVYSRKAHFVYELVQNADDNFYPMDVKPSLVFELFIENSQPELWLLNNEVGFCEKDIRSLCDIGQSTKLQRKSDATGRKGIGFKSVFNISHNPEIHSNEFHFRFNVSSAQHDINSQSSSSSSSCDYLGAVVPHCCDIHPRILQRSSQWKTQIRLPLLFTNANADNDDTVAHKEYQLMKKLLQTTVSASLLLFLRRIQNLCVVWNEYNNEEQQHKCVYTKHIRPNDRIMIECSHTDKSLEWFVYEHIITPSVVNEKLFTQRGVQQSSIIIAMTTKSEDIKPESVFVYLPLRCFGLRFIINADFDLTTSREDVNEDSLWNHYIRSQIPMALQCTILKFISMNKSIETATLILDSLPLPGEVNGFFHALPNQLMRELSRVAFLLDENQILREPCQLVLDENLCENDYENDKFPKDDPVWQTLSFKRLHPNVTSLCDLHDWKECRNRLSRRKQILHGLACSALTIDHIIDHMAEHISQETYDLNELCVLLSGIHAMISTSPPYLWNQAKRRLLHLPLYPLLDGSLSSLESKNDQDFNNELVFWIPKVILDQLPQELCWNRKILNPHLFEDKESIGDLLKEMGMKLLNHENVLELLVFPLMKANVDDVNILLQSTLFIRNSCTFVSKDILRQNMPILSCKDSQIVTLKESSAPIYLHSCYLPNEEKQEYFLVMFPIHCWTCISPLYLNVCPNIHLWSSFWRSLGVVDEILPECVEYEGNDKTKTIPERIQSHLASLNTTTHAGSILVKDFDLPLIQTIATIESVDEKGQFYSLLLTLISKNWRKWEPFVFMEMPIVSQNVHRKTINNRSQLFSSWIDFLSKQPTLWIQSIDGQKSLASPKEYFWPLKGNLSNLGLSQACIVLVFKLFPSPLSVSLHREFMDLLGIITQVDIQNIKTIFTEIVRSKSKWNWVDLEMMKCLYSVLIKHLSSHDLAVFLNDLNSVIFIPALPPNKTQQGKANEFVKPKNLFIEPLEKLFPTNGILHKVAVNKLKYPPLSTIYGNEWNTKFNALFKVSLYPSVSNLILSLRDSIQQHELMPWLTEWYGMIISLLNADAVSLNCIQSMDIIRTRSGKWKMPNQVFAVLKPEFLSQLELQGVEIIAGDFFAAPLAVVDQRSLNEVTELLEDKLQIVVFDKVVKSSVLVDNSSLNGEDSRRKRSSTLKSLWQDCVPLVKQWLQCNSSTISINIQSVIQRLDCVCKFYKINNLLVKFEWWWNDANEDSVLSFTCNYDSFVCEEEGALYCVDLVDPQYEQTLCDFSSLVVSALVSFALPRSQQSIQDRLEVFLFGYYDLLSENADQRTIQRYLRSHGVRTVDNSVSLKRHRREVMETDDDFPNRSKRPHLSSVDNGANYPFSSESFQSQSTSAPPPAPPSAPVQAFFNFGSSAPRDGVPPMLSADRVNYFNTSLHSSCSSAKVSSFNVKRSTEGARPEQLHQKEMILRQQLERNSLNNGNNNNNNAQVTSGRLGEMVAYRYLLDNRRLQLENGEVLLIDKVQWMNENAESGLPFDFRAVVSSSLDNNGHGNGGRFECLFEVKSTVTENMRQLVDISLSELNCAHRNPGKYHIVRVSNLNSLQHVRIDVIYDLLKQLQNNSIKIKLIF